MAGLRRGSWDLGFSALRVWVAFGGLGVWGFGDLGFLGFEVLGFWVWKCDGLWILEFWDFGV